MRINLLALVFLLGLGLSAFGQSNVKKNMKPGSTDAVTSGNSEKKNSRAESAPIAVVSRSFQPVFVYQYTRPGFTYGKVQIRHDEKGTGEIVFERDASDETVKDPIQLSEATTAKLKQLFADLNFVSSTEDYQYERDYPHMGSVEITATLDGKTRTAKFNWTTHKLAKELADEYRRISNEYTWKFELGVSLENQPLQGPGLMDLLTGYMDRNEISDPPHMLPLLQKLASDERMPLMGRNRAAKLVEKIKKDSK